MFCPLDTTSYLLSQADTHSNHTQTHPKNKTFGTGIRFQEWEVLWVTTRLSLGKKQSYNLSIDEARLRFICCQGKNYGLEAYGEKNQPLEKHKTFT